jgi:hypothetical protein
MLWPVEKIALEAPYGLIWRQYVRFAKTSKEKWVDAFLTRAKQGPICDASKIDPNPEMRRRAALSL